MTNIKKQNIYIDVQQQHKERNISLNDYPVFNIKTGRQLKHTFSYYFEDLDDYFGSKNPAYKTWSDKYKFTSQEAFLFFEDVESKEYRHC